MLGGPSLFVDAASYFHHQAPQQQQQPEQEQEYHDSVAAAAEQEEEPNQQPASDAPPASSSRRRRGRGRGRGKGRGVGEGEEEGEEGEEGSGGEGDEEEEEGEGRGQGRGKGRSSNRRGSRVGGGHGRGRSSISSLPSVGTMEATTRLLLPASRIGGVIGRGGEVIKGIRELTGARINISANPGSGDGEEDRDPHYRLVSVSGGVSSVCSAVELVARQAGLFDGLGGSEGRGSTGGRRGRRDSAGGEDDYSEGGGGPLGLRMVIDGSVAGQLIGKKGATINDIRQQSGARIQVLTDEDSLDEGGIEGERVVTIQGEETSCRLAHQLICSVLAAEPENGAEHEGGGGGGRRRSSHAGHGRRESAVSVGGAGGGGEAEGEEGDEESCQVTMRIPNDKIGRVIGKQGETINSIRQETGCRIDIENTRSGEHAMRTVRIKGGLEATQLAQQLITQKIQAEPDV